MRRKSKVSLEPRNIVVALSVLCVIMMIISFKFERQVSPVKTVVGGIFAPMQKGINSLGGAVANKLDIFGDVKSLRAENDKLKEKLDAIRGENRILQQNKSELEDLRKLYSLDEEYADLPKVAARVTSKDATNWYSTFTIDKGKKDGIEVNMNVIANDGLVGIVSEAGYNYSKVRTIIDDKSNVTAVFLKSTELCNVAGSLKTMSEGKVIAEDISKEVNVKNGDAIYTAYDSPKFHSGILIGYVSDVNVDANNVTMSGKVTPVVDFTSLETVLIITKVKEELKK